MECLCLIRLQDTKHLWSVSVMVAPLVDDLSNCLLIRTGASLRENGSISPNYWLLESSKVQTVANLPSSHKGFFIYFCFQWFVHKVLFLVYWFQDLYWKGIQVRWQSCSFKSVTKSAKGENRETNPNLGYWRFFYPRELHICDIIRLLVVYLVG